MAHTAVRGRRRFKARKKQRLRGYGGQTHALTAPQARIWASWHLERETRYSPISKAAAVFDARASTLAVKTADRPRPRVGMWAFIEQQIFPQRYRLTNTMKTFGILDL